MWAHQVIFKMFLTDVNVRLLSTTSYRFVSEPSKRRSNNRFWRSRSSSAEGIRLHCRPIWIFLWTACVRISFLQNQLTGANFLNDKLNYRLRDALLSRSCSPRAISMFYLNHFEIVEFDSLWSAENQTCPAIFFGIMDDSFQWKANREGNSRRPCSRYYPRPASSKLKR